MRKRRGRTGEADAGGRVRVKKEEKEVAAVWRKEF